MQALSINETSWLREFLASHVAGKRRKHVRKGDRLFEKGQEIKEIFLITHGRIRVDASSPHGKVILVQQCGPNDWLTEGALDDEAFYTHTATALTETDLYAFARETFPRLLQEHTPLQKIFTVGLARSAKMMREVLDNRLLNPAHTRLAHELLDMFGKSDAPELFIEATPTKLGDMVGIARQTASKIIKAFASVGMLTPQRGGYTLNRAELEKFMRWADSPGGNTAHELAHYLLDLGVDE
ncbi:Crp/Fnr family transcriptional regulator [Bradyrhizobium sp. USDA 313]|uniref:Crp/Fnr family transcriptional regulator n=1 Tax=Bradyrhizobium sp. USDA 313 TaxID=3156307 RepID=UPI00351410F6